MKKQITTLTIAVVAFTVGLGFNNFAMSDIPANYKVAVVDVNAVVSKSAQVQALKKEQQAKLQELQKWLETVRADVQKQSTKEGKEKLIEQGKELKELREKILEADPEQLTSDDRSAYRGVIKGIENATGINFTQTEPGNFQRQQTEIRQVDNLTETQNFAQTEQENPQPEQTETQNLAQTGQEKPQPEQQAQQPPENNPEEDKKDEKKKKQASPEQSEFKRGQAWRAAKYSFLGGLCGLLLLATILLGIAGMLPIFFICLACTIGACIITSGELTSDIKKANEESLKARTEQNKQKAAELGREIAREKQAQQRREEELEAEELHEQPKEQSTRQTENSSERIEDLVQSEPVETEAPVQPKGEEKETSETAGDPRVPAATGEAAVGGGETSSYQIHIGEIRRRAQELRHKQAQAQPTPVQTTPVQTTPVQSTPVQTTQAHDAGGRGM